MSQTLTAGRTALTGTMQTLTEGNEGNRREMLVYMQHRWFWEDHVW